ncbi:MAG: hypothetical protein EXR71_16700 [Myxococcales bacterium]|nr:hypothetical protein [Myxococcales bacterium]
MDLVAPLLSPVLRSWELRALGAGVAVGVLAWVVGRRARGRRLSSWEHPWAWDLLALSVVLAVQVPAVLRVWGLISPNGSPVGADSDYNFLSAVAIETGNTALYAIDRYPGFPWAASLIADGSRELAAGGLRVSMAASFLSGFGAYWLARQLHGRLAGALAMCVVLRLPGLVDCGRQFTPYALVAAADLIGVASLVALSRGRLLATVPLAGVAGVLFTADPKQLPVAMAMVGLGALFLVLSLRWAALPALGLLGGVLPTVNDWMGRQNLPIASIEEITTRVSLGFDVDPALPRDGWVPGQSFGELVSTLQRVAAAVSAPETRGWFAPAALPGIRMEFPDTSSVWVLLALTLPVLMLVQRAGLRAALLPLAVSPLAVVLVSCLHLHFQHRYFLAVAVCLPPLAIAALARLVGPWGCLAAGMVALIPGSSPWRREAPGLLGGRAVDTDSWSGVESPEWFTVSREYDARLPADAVVLDYASSRPWVMMAALRPYVRCVGTRDTCRSHLSDAGSLHAVLFPGEPPSAQDAPDASDLWRVIHAPAVVGTCWTRVGGRPGNGALYAWSCEDRPVTLRIRASGEPPR